MKKSLFGKASVFLAGMTLVACGNAGNDAAGTGSVNFDLNLPDGQTVNTIKLDIACPGVTQSHTLNVVNGAVVAAFGGLTPGACTVALATQTANGTDCAGNRAFDVVAGQIANVEVTLVCQGVNTSNDGAAKVSTKFSLQACTDDRIKKIYAIPSNLLLGEKTVVEAEINAGAVKGTPKYSWSVRNDATHTAEGTLATATCAAGSASCQQFTCTGLGAASTVDATTGLPTSAVFVSVKYEDDDCFDTEEVWVDCLQSSVCGDGAVAGVEQCDDGNTASNDGCSASCRTERCGDGIVQTGEACDGSAPAGFTCTAACALEAVTVPPVCGDGIKNQSTEECDGTSGVVAGQTCGADCKFVAVCGNGIKEGAEECDETSATCVACKVVAGPNACDTCIAGLPDIGEFNTSVCQTNTQCKAALSCLLTNSTCWNNLASASCYCGDTQADIDACENPTFVAKGKCAAEMRAAAGSNPTNAEVLARYFDFDYAVGHATIITDAANIGCKSACF